MIKNGTWVLLACITALMVVIREAGVFAIPWVIVFAPLWVPLAFYVIVLIAALIAIIVVLFIQKVSKPTDSD